MNKEYFTYVLTIDVPNLTIDDKEIYHYDTIKNTNLNYYDYLLDYVKLQTSAIEYYKSILDSYFKYGIFHNQRLSLNRETYDGILYSSTFKNDYTNNVTIIIDIDGDEDDLSEFNKYEINKEFKYVLPSKYIKEIMINDPYLGDLIISNPNYDKNKLENGFMIYSDDIRNIDILCNNSI